MEKVRVSMRTLGADDEGLGPKNIDVVVEVEPTLQGLQRMITALYERYFDEDASRMVRAAVSGSSVQTVDLTNALEFLVARMESGVRAVPHFKPVPTSSNDMDAELRKLDASMAKSIVAINAVEVGNATRAWEEQKEVRDLHLMKMLQVMDETVQKGVDMHGPLKAAWLEYTQQRDHVSALFQAIPQPQYAVVNTASGVPVTKAAIAQA